MRVTLRVVVQSNKGGVNPCTIQIKVCTDSCKNRIGVAPPFTIIRFQQVSKSIPASFDTPLWGVKGVAPPGRIQQVSTQIDSSKFRYKSIPASFDTPPWGLWGLPPLVDSSKFRQNRLQKVPIPLPLIAAMTAISVAAFLIRAPGDL